MGKKTTVEEKATTRRRVQIIRMKYVKCKTGKDIAKELGVSIETVWNTIQQYREILEKGTIEEAVVEATKRGYL